MSDIVKRLEIKINNGQFKMTEYTKKEDRKKHEKWNLVDLFLSKNDFTFKATGMLLDYLFSRNTSAYFLMSQPILLEKIKKYPYWDRKSINGNEYKKFRAILQDREIIEVISEPTPFTEKKNNSRTAGLWKITDEDILGFLDLSNDYKSENDALSAFIRSQDRNTVNLPKTTPDTTTENDSEDDFDNKDENNNEYKNRNALQESDEELKPEPIYKEFDKNEFTKALENWLLKPETNYFKDFADCNDWDARISLKEMGIIPAEKSKFRIRLITLDDFVSLKYRTLVKNQLPEDIIHNVFNKKFPNFSKDNWVEIFETIQKQLNKEDPDYFHEIFQRIIGLGERVDMDILDSHDKYIILLSSLITGMNQS